MCRFRNTLLSISLLTFGCGPSSDPDFSIDFEKYELENGLNVVLHIDRSDPLAAVAMTFHVGSSREVEGKTGFAHLFEHLFFLDSENLGPGGLDRLMTRVGSSTNGSTNRDRTNYFEVVPNDALEKALWAEADKLGFFINTVTESVLEKEREVVKNEKRQSVDNRPYGHTNFVIDRALYPEGHPYRWQVIGSLDDLSSASLEDVKEFHGRWYGPNNATLVVAGDLDVDQTKAWINKYFGEIPAVDMQERPIPPPVVLTENRLLFHEDNFANLPMLSISWPSVPSYHPDSYALNLLTDLLTDGKTTPFHQVIVEEEKLAPRVSMYHSTQELGGRLTLQILAFDGTNLNDVYGACQTAFERFETNGVSRSDLDRVKAGYETSFYNRLGSAIGKAFQLAQYNIFAGSPGYIEEDIERILTVTQEDLFRVYEKYIQSRSFVATSFVPRGATGLVLNGSERAEVVEEPIVQSAENPVEITGRDQIPMTPSRIDRTVEPPFGEPPSLSAPDVWRDELVNGLEVYGIEDFELPLVQFELRMKGGVMLESREAVGAANLLAETLTAGTANKTPEELEQAIDALGATISVSASPQSFVIRASSLARNFAATLALVEEILLQPRWDRKEFDLAKTRVQNSLRQRAASPNGVAGDAFSRLLYREHILGANPAGTVESVEAIGIPDLQSFYEKTLKPNVASFLVVGSIEQPAVTARLKELENRWEPGEIRYPDAPSMDHERGLFFVDIPGSSQSVLRIGYLAPPQTDPAYYPATIMNYRFGGGGFASDLTQVLREQKGYTYGIRSGFRGTDVPGPFVISSGVRSNVTLEALQEILGIMQTYGSTFDGADLDATKDYLLKSNALAFETLSSKLNILRNMSAFAYPADYVLQREAIVRSMTTTDIAELAREYLDPGKMVWLVVGDATTQLPRLRSLGLGGPILIDRTGIRLN